MSVVITGAAGFVGAALTRRIAREQTVHALVHPRTDTLRLPESPAVVVHRVDLAVRDDVAKALDAIGPSTVFHAAAAGGHARRGERTRMWHDCVTTTIALLDALDHVGACRLVHLGSSTMYQPSESPLRESDPVRPVCARGAAKAAASLAVREWGDGTGVPVVDLRLFRVYGPDEQPGRLVPAVLRSLRTGEPLPTPPATTRRDMVHVDDVVEACVRATTVPTSQVLNVGFGRGHTVEEVVAAFSDAAGRPIHLVRGARALEPHDAPHHAADMTHTAEVLGWRPQIDLRTGAAMVLAAA